MQIKRLLIFFFFYSGLFAQIVHIKIIETSDVHGAIYPFNFIDNKKAAHSLSQVHAFVKAERNKAGQNVLLLDNGDILQGDPAIYYYNFIDTGSIHLLADIMNYMKYDAATVGNHDIETGHAVYDKFSGELNFEWLAANAVDLETNEPYFRPYFITYTPSSFNLDRSAKIAVLGLITPGIPNWLPRNIWSGIEFEDMILTAKKWTEFIKEKEDPDLLIGLFHSGVDFKYDNQNKKTPRNENASQLVAEQVPGFDIVFVGHDHHEWNYKVENVEGDSVLILGPSARAASIAAAEVIMNFNHDLEKWEKKISGNIINTGEIEPDEEFIDRYSNQFEEIKKYVSRPIGFFTEKISAQNSIFGNSSFVDLIHKVQLDLTGADISFTAPLSIYAKIDSGEVYVRDIFDLYRYENLLYTMELTGKEIKDYLEFSYSNWFNTMQNKDDNLLLFERDNEGGILFSKRSNTAMLKNRYYNFDSAEGIYYTVDVSKPFGKKINITALDNGTPFDLDKKYTVAINSYRGNGGGGHLVNGAGIPKEELTNRIVSSTEKDLRYFIMKWIEEQNIVAPLEVVNWKILPEEWIDEAKERDFLLMYGSN